MPLSDEQRRHRARIAALSRHHGEDDPRIIDARVELKDSAAREYVTRLVDEAPPLRPEQIERLRHILAGGLARVESGGAA